MMLWSEVDLVYEIVIMMASHGPQGRPVAAYSPDSALITLMI
jgi:hypothetical protein